MFDAAEKLQINFYEYVMELDEIAARIGTTEALIGELEILGGLPQGPPLVENRGQRNRWKRLTGELPSIQTETEQ